jgi:hypothetical protein
MSCEEDNRSNLLEEASRIRREYRSLSTSSADFMKRKNALLARYREIERLLAPAKTATTSTPRKDVVGEAIIQEPPPLPSQLAPGSGNNNPPTLPRVPKETKIRIDMRALFIIASVFLVVALVGLYVMTTGTNDRDGRSLKQNGLASPPMGKSATEPNSIGVPSPTQIQRQTGISL